MRNPLIICWFCITGISCTEKQALFTVVESRESNIFFTNAIVENDMINMINYQYLYNGGGMALGILTTTNCPISILLHALALINCI